MQGALGIEPKDTPDEQRILGGQDSDMQVLQAILQYRAKAVMELMGGVETELGVQCAPIGWPPVTNGIYLTYSMSCDTLSSLNRRLEDGYASSGATWTAATS